MEKMVDSEVMENEDVKSDITQGDVISSSSPNIVTTDFVEIGRPSLFFHELNCSDFGKESLGLLPANFDRDSLFSNTFRESLGILNITIMDVGRESLLTLPSTSKDREQEFSSKSMTDLQSFSCTFDEKETLNGLNLGFIDESLPKASSYNSTNFNSMSLEGPSAIYSVSCKTVGSQNSEDLEIRLNNDLSSNFKFSTGSSVSSIHSALNKARLLSALDMSDIRTRVKSLPVHLEEEIEADDKNGFNKKNISKTFWSAEKVLKTNSVLSRSFHATLDFDEEEEKDFNDSVFIEANHVAYKIANNSIYEEDDDDDVSSFSIDFPEDSNVEETKERKLKPDAESVFKIVDKLVVPNSDIKIKIKCSKSDINSISETASLPENISIASNNNKEHSHNLSKLSQESEKDPLTILKNLSEILHDTDQLSKSQKSESQNMINNLASILSEPRGSNDLEDSGHSSIDEPFECPLKKQLNISNRSTMRNNNVQNSSKVGVNLKASTSKVKPIVKIKVNKSNISASSNDRSKSSNCSENALTVSKGKTIGVKKGPMKAVIPMPSMAKKHCAPVTPNRQSELTVPKEMNSKRTSTPIHEPKLKPMAASTPANLIMNNARKLDVSPLSRPRISKYSATRPIINSAQKVVNKPLSSVAKTDKKLVRSNSVNEYKMTSFSNENVKDIKFRRSNSVGKETGLMKALSKVRQNIINSPYYKQPSPEGGLSENIRHFTSGLPKPLNLALKIKNTGKENLET